jgi:hypothetical protein
MTVKELKEELSKFDDNTEVFYLDDDRNQPFFIDFVRYVFYDRDNHKYYTSTQYMDEVVLDCSAKGIAVDLLSINGASRIVLIS